MNIVQHGRAAYSLPRQAPTHTNLASLLTCLVTPFILNSTNLARPHLAIFLVECFKRQPENSNSAHLRVLVFTNTTKIQQENTTVKAKKSEMVRKKREILGGQAEGGPAEGVRWIGSGARWSKHHQHEPQQQKKTNNQHHKHTTTHKQPTPTPTTTQHKWIGQKWIGQNWMAKVGHYPKGAAPKGGAPQG